MASVGGRACDACASQFTLRGVRVAARYERGLREAILALKFRRLRGVVEVAAGLVTPLVSAGEFELVTSVPIAPARYRERGYNQSELIARRVARRLELPYRTLLGRQGAVHQLGLGRADRLARVQGEFYGARRLAGQRVLVVDDVVTTAATLEECARVLMAAGAGEVWGAAVARH
ncbi:MAG TPA: phosphoribosyltransferase family protein [Candidatus Saccharimonadia bacterium]